MTVRRAVRARPNRSPARNWRGRREAGRSRARVRRRPSAVVRSAGGVVVVGAAVAAEREPDGQERQADRDDVGLVPGRRELGRVPEDRPEGEEDRRRRAGPAVGPAAGRASTSTSATSTAARIVKISLVVRGEAPDGHERQEHDRRQRREGQQPARDAVARGDRQDVLEVGVARALPPVAATG